MVGNGTNIPLDHPAWFLTPNLHNSNLNLGTVADLIDHANHFWKPDLVRSLYRPSISSEILRIPISKTGSVKDSLMWKFSNSGDFNVKKAYEILLEEANVLANENLRPHIIPAVVWNTLWKVKLPLKIYNLVWKVIHDSLPTFQALRARGIPIATLCPFCDCEEGSASHLFLHCHFARACWYGSALALHTSSLGPIAVRQWIINYIIKNKSLDESGLRFLQLIFITFWAIWNHRNRVVHEGVTPDPMNVILTTQNLFCRYQEIYQKHHSTEHRLSKQKTMDQGLCGQWSIILKISGVKQGRKKESCFAYEARNRQDTMVFYECSSSAARSISVVLLEGLREATVAASRLQFNQILVLSNCNFLVQMFITGQAPDWEGKTLFADLESLKQQGICFSFRWIPASVLVNVHNMAVMASSAPMHFQWPQHLTL